MISLHRVMFALELILAELIFLYPLPRRRSFPGRLALSLAVCVLISNFCVLRMAWMPSVLRQLIRLVAVYGSTICMMCFCFDRKPACVLSACAAGYAVEHINFQIVKIIDLTTSFPVPLFPGSARWEMIEYVLLLPSYLFFLLTLGRYARRHQSFQHSDSRVVVPFVIIFLITIGLTRVADFFGDSGSLTVCVYAIACCGMALAVQLILFNLMHLQAEKNTIQLLWQEDQRQFELSKRTIEQINIKYHDLKKRLRELRTMLSAEEITSMEQAISIYDCKVRTGNEALDVLLTQNTLLCQGEGITMTYTGSGADFSFMSTMDVYSLFGNAIDNAIEAVRKVDNPEKRVVDIVTERKGPLTMLIVRNYFAEPLKMEDGALLTTKKEEEGFHGYGVKSIRLLAKKYRGDVSIRAEGGVFTLMVTLFPPAEAA